jgi:hypothetical protein
MAQKEKYFWAFEIFEYLEVGTDTSVGLVTVIRAI